MKWVCDHCGERGRVPDGESVDTILCSTCGEPVLADR